jgi:multiple antibiotic resistance protein
MIHDQKLFVTQLVTLVAVLDPVGHLTLFLTATVSLSRGQRRRDAVVAVFVALVILVAFGVLGQYVLHAMGISLLSFQIAGGIIIFVFALSMVLGESHGPGAVPDSGSVAIYPLAVPIIAGPGSMLTMVVLMDNNRFSLVDQAITILALALVLAVLLSVFLLGDLLSRMLSGGVTNVLRRVMGLILAALSINLVLNAVVQWLGLPSI